MVVDRFNKLLGAKSNQHAQNYYANLANECAPAVQWPWKVEVHAFNLNKQHR
jgi:hypothetical protein